MAITAFKTFVTGEVLLASDLNSSFSRNLDQINVNTVDIATNVTNITANDVQLARGDNHGKNLVINGDFSVWQRGTSFTTNNVYTADRFLTTFVSTTGAGTVTRQAHTVGQTAVPGNPEFFFRHDQTTQLGAAATIFDHRIESVRTAGGSSIRLTIYAKAGSNKTFAVRTLQAFGSGGSAAVATATQNIAVTTSFTKFTLTFAIASISGKTVGSDHYLSIQIQDLTPSVFTLDLSNFQIELGSIETDFEIVSPADQLVRCQRYFESIAVTSGGYVTVGQAISATQVEASLRYSEKRAVPTISSTGTIASGDSSGSNAGGTSSFLVIGVDMAIHRVSGASGLVAGNASFVHAVGGAATIDVDAEL